MTDARNIAFRASAPEERPSEAVAQELGISRMVYGIHPKIFSRLRHQLRQLLH